MGDNLWFDTNTNKLKVCNTDNSWTEVAAPLYSEEEISDKYFNGISLEEVQVMLKKSNPEYFI